MRAYTPKVLKHRALVAASLTATLLPPIAVASAYTQIPSLRLLPAGFHTQSSRRGHEELLVYYLKTRLRPGRPAEGGQRITIDWLESIRTQDCRGRFQYASSCYADFAPETLTTCTNLVWLSPSCLSLLKCLRSQIPSSPDMDTSSRVSKPLLFSVHGSTLPAPSMSFLSFITGRKGQSLQWLMTSVYSLMTNGDIFLHSTKTSCYPNDSSKAMPMLFTWQVRQLHLFSASSIALYVVSVAQPGINARHIMGIRNTMH